MRVLDKLYPDWQVGFNVHKTLLSFLRNNAKKIIFSSNIRKIKFTSNSAELKIFYS
jgi:hypothetical protein